MTLQFLLLEDSLLDAELIQAALREGRINGKLLRVETRSDFLKALEQTRFDLILADYGLPSFDGITALKIAQTTCPDIPFIFVSATLGEEVAIEMLKSGATDYVLKQRLGRLVPSVQRALREARERLEHKQAEEALRESEDRYRRLFEQNPQPMWVFDRDTLAFLAVNQSAIHHYGYSQDEFLKMTLRDICPPEDILAVIHQLSQIFPKQTYAGTWRHWKKNGILIDVEVTAYEDHFFGRHAQLVLVNDITEQKRAEAERDRLLIREQQHRQCLQKLAEASLAIFSAQSLDERLRLITEKARDIIKAHQSVTSMTVDVTWAKAIHSVSLSDKYAEWQDYTAQPDGSGIYAFVCQMQRPVRMTQAELEAHPDWRGFGKEAGKHPPMRGLLAAPFSSGNDQNIGLIQLSDKDKGEFTEEDEAILIQFAQMASTAIDNARLYDHSQRANRVKDEFLATLSHELRSPLNAILGWSKLLRSQKFDEATTARALGTIERNAKLQTQLIEDLLDVSRIIQGKLSLNVCSINLVSPIEAAIETMRLAAEAKSVQVQTFLGPGVGIVSGDSNRLQQIVWNLLSNAIKFTPPGGTVEIRLNSVESQVQIQVKDTGKGIKPDFLPHVFDYFRQADSGITRRFGGLGLGLAIVRHLVELHGGTVFAESPGDGQGATFTVLLPLISTQLQMEEDPETFNAENALDGVRVLVVDDEPDTREFLSFMLEQHGAEIKAVESAGAALEILKEFKPDVLVSDIGMPGMDGYMLMRQIRTLSEGQAGIPAIALTAYAGELDQQKAIASGFQRHLAKPVESDELVTAIATLVREFANP